MAKVDVLNELLGVQHAILQAPMAGMATPELAAAVSNAGALGGLGLGSSSVATARQMIRATRALTDQPFNVNFFCHQPAQRDAAREAAWLAYLRPLFEEFNAKPPEQLALRYPSFSDNHAMLEMLLEERPAVVSFIFGVPPKAWIDALQDAGIVTLGCATNLDEARKIEQAGLDGIVAQGAEAGGHRGVFNAAADLRMGGVALVRLLAANCRLPVIAAGGIMDGQGINAMHNLGAAGVQLGTAFILCPESAAKPAHRAALKSTRSLHTEITDMISGRPARGLVNRLHTDVVSTQAPVLPDYPVCYDAAKALAQAAVAAGCNDFSPQWAGQGAPLARELPAAELIAALVVEQQGR